MKTVAIFFLLCIVRKIYGQGYYLDVNGSTSSYPSSEVLSVNSQMPLYVYDEVYRHYRSDVRKREPQFLGFDIQDDNIEIDMEIAVPFLSVPKKGGVGKRNALANINVAAVILAGFVALGGTLLGGAARFFRGDNFFDGKPLFRTGNKKKKHKRDIGNDEFVWDILNNIDHALLEIDFDIVACAARSVCWHVKNSFMNVQENRARKIDKFISGFSNADWAHRVISNPLFLDAMEAGKNGFNCETRYKTCAISQNNLEDFTRKIQEKVKPKKSRSHFIHDSA